MDNNDITYRTYQKVVKMDIFQIFYNNKNEENAYYMAKYMKDKFPFLGLKSK